MTFEPGKSANPKGRPRGHGISYFIGLALDELLPGSTKNKKQAIAEKLISIALDPNTSNKDFLIVATELMDRLEGKAVTTNLNAEVSTNPFEGIDTSKLEALKAKLATINGK